MKIAAISASKIPAATANSIQVMKTCQALAQLDNELMLFTPDLDREFLESKDDLLSFYGLQKIFPIVWLHSSPHLGRYDFSLRATWKAKALKSDLVYCWPIQAAVFGLLMNLPVVLEMHGPPEGRIGPLLFDLFVKMPGKKRILFITHALQTIVEERFRNSLSVHTALIAPNGIDLARYGDLPEPSQARQSLRLPDVFTAVYTGHLYPGRGMELMVALAERSPNVHFLWVGGNPGDIMNWRERLNRQTVDNITLIGFIPNDQLAVYQAAGDVLLMPYERLVAGSSGGNSADYCSPMKMFEYMACQRPILTSDLSVIREVLNENNAVLCPPEDLGAWSKALEKLMLDEVFRQRLAAQARADVQNYTWKQRAEKALHGFV
jgi:glycosyltransferase involved in cell wall biosynthesis